MTEVSFKTEQRTNGSTFVAGYASENNWQYLAVTEIILSLGNAKNYIANIHVFRVNLDGSKVFVKSVESAININTWQDTLTDVLVNQHYGL